jgi:hypothetical protein
MSFGYGWWPAFGDGVVVEGVVQLAVVAGCLFGGVSGVRHVGQGAV